MQRTSVRRALRKMAEVEPLPKLPKSYRLSEECRKMIEQLSAYLGINQTSVVELAVRKLARMELGAKTDAPAKPKRGKA